MFVVQVVHGDRRSSSADSQTGRSRAASAALGKGLQRVQDVKENKVSFLTLGEP